MPLRKPLVALLIALCFAPMLSFAYIGFFTRPISDDFCHLDHTAQLLPWEAFIRGLQHNNGSFSHLLVMSLLGPLGYGVIPISAALHLGLLFAISAALINRRLALMRLARNRRVAALALAALLTGTFAGSLYTVQTLYKYNSTVKYSGQLVFITLYMLLLHIASRAGGRGKPLMTAAGAALAFAITGFSETSALPVFIALTLLCVAAATSRKRGGGGCQCSAQVGSQLWHATWS